MAPRDRIQLRGLRVLGTIGALPEEQVRAQPFEVDLDVECDLSAAGASDDLDDTLDYGEIASTVARVVASERHQLLERVAQRIADDVLAHDTRVTAVAVTVRKLRPPVPVDLATAAVTITRARTTPPNFSRNPPSEGGSERKSR
ncbi:MAG TPA: dihydroneopterin aldolase [Acidimicrobiales bacterium]|nr:dihydroneopterin aldolase [Acidimicrobiales bacterium]